MGESVERVTLALVPAVVENCVQEVPPFKLYCQRSAVAEEDAEILNPLAVMLETEQDTVGAERSMLFRVTVVEAVIVPIDTRNKCRKTATKRKVPRLDFVPSALWLTLTVLVSAASFSSRWSNPRWRVRCRFR